MYKTRSIRPKSRIINIAASAKQKKAAIDVFRRESAETSVRNQAKIWKNNRPAPIPVQVVKLMMYRPQWTGSRIPVMLKPFETWRMKETAAKTVSDIRRFVAFFDIFMNFVLPWWFIVYCLSIAESILTNL